MTEKDLLLLDSLKTNISNVFSEYKLLEEKYSQLKQRLQEKESSFNNLSEEHDKLIEENKKLRIANHLLTNDDKDNLAKKNINKIIREIDKCIALLNK